MKKGTPIRIEIGPRDIESRKVCLQRRDQSPADKAFLDKEDFLQNVTNILQEIHDNMLAKARAQYPLTQRRNRLHLRKQDRAYRKLRLVGHINESSVSQFISQALHIAPL